MEKRISLPANRFKCLFVCLSLALLFNSCTNLSLVDVNLAIPENSWTYAKRVKTLVEITDSTLSYNMLFKIRNTADYRYSNIFVIARVKSGKKILRQRRYQFQLAKSDGHWIGKGSGDLYSNTFPILTNFRFPQSGKYEIEIEQNMRDNPLVGISDIGITIEHTKKD